MVCCVAGSAGKSKDWRQPFAASNDGFMGERWMLPQADFKRNLVENNFLEVNPHFVEPFDAGLRTVAR
jgi:hypothetical protein